MKSVFLCLIFLSKVFAEDYQKPFAISTNASPPTPNTGIPDLTTPMEFYKCFSIKDSRACGGMDDYHLPETGVFYGDVTSFDKYANSEVNNDSGILKALCPNANIQHDLKKIAYRYSVFCGRYLYAQARWCPQNSENVRANPKFSLCKSTCLEYAKSMADYGQNVCGNTDNAIGEKIKENIINKWCNIFTDEKGCLKGINKEVKNCGYDSATYALDAQKFNPHNSCWGTDGNDENMINKLKEEAVQEQKEQKKMGGIKWQVAYPLGSVGVVAVLTMFFWVKQNKKFNRGYIEKSNTKNDYEIIPSLAEPSREYVNDDFIKKFELEIPKATLARSGSLSVKKLSRVQSQVQKPNDKKYMVAIYNYHPQRDDELELRSGDRIRVEHEYEDGWGAGINEITNKFGAFPLICCTTNITNNEEALPKRSKSRITASSSVKRRTTQQEPPVPNIPEQHRPTSQLQKTLY